MKIFYVGVLKNTGGAKALELAAAKDLSDFGFFERSGADQFMSFFSTTIAERTDAGKRQSVEEGDKYIAHAYARSEGLCAILITDKEYPVRPAFTLLNKVLDDYITAHPPIEWKSATETSASLDFPQLSNYIKKYQDPSQADSIMRVQQELDETKVVLHKTIEGVLERGEKLDSLVDKSESLSASSKMFYKQAKKTNSCCVIM